MSDEGNNKGLWKTLRKEGNDENQIKSLPNKDLDARKSDNLL